MIKILARNRVIAHQEAASDGAIEGMVDRDLAGVENLLTCEPNHYCNPLISSISGLSQVKSLDRESMANVA